ncbi:MAG: beta-galactosidase [Clostridia bacterium]|nr:beta-galactosidase [Clostridia bacterium]
MVFKIEAPKEPHVLPGFSGTILGSEYGATSSYLTKNGRPYIYRMGEVQFSRIPEVTWEEALTKAKNGGIDVISSYVFWIHHEEIEGEFLFDGNRNIKKFLAICRRLSLPFILRLGPWVHGEARNGGFPDWLKGVPNIALRTVDDTYFFYVRRFFERLYEEVKEFSDVILGVQLENELRANREYAEKLKELLLDIGFHPPYFTFTGWGGADRVQNCPAGEVLCVYGGYPEAPWNQNLDPIDFNPHYVLKPERDDSNIGADLVEKSEQNEDELSRKRLIEDTPYLTCETGGGMHVTYHRRPIVSTLDVSALSLCKLGSGSNGVGYYVYHGGKNPIGKTTTTQESHSCGYPNDLPMVSYDFQAPLGEAGQIRETYYVLKRLHNFLELCGEELATMPAYFSDDIERRPKQNGFTASVRSDGKRGYLFVCNHARLTVPKALTAIAQIDLPSGESVSIDLCVPPYAHGIIPFRFPIGSEVVSWMTAVPQRYDGQTLHLAKNANMEPVISLNGRDVTPIVSGMSVGGVTLILDDDPVIPARVETPVALTKAHAAAAEDFYSHIRNLDKTTPVFGTPDAYELRLPEGAKYLRIRAKGNVGALYRNGRLLGDYYFYGVDWIVDVRTLPAAEPLTLYVLPLNEEDKAKIYWEYDMPTGSFVPEVFACNSDTIHM